MGWALEQQGFPDTESFHLDVTLWPLEEQPDERERMWQAFEAWLIEQEIRLADKVKTQGLSLYRVVCSHAGGQTLLEHRDVRGVDLPPCYGLDRQLLSTDVQNLSAPSAPPGNAPTLAVLDSGLATGHPLLRVAVGEAASFLLGKDAADENGHGTMVAGLAMHGDVEAAIQSGNMAPRFWLLSGRILDENNENETVLVENQIDEAVRYFYQQYNCRVFNLSFGDRNKPYNGKHLGSLAFTLDSLSRELGVLFVVSAGNVHADSLAGRAWREEYPEYLCRDEWAIVEPAPALNALTIGSLARYDRTFNSQRYDPDPVEVPVARRKQPSPFSRHGPSIGGAIKPDLVAFGGNWAVNSRAGADTLVPKSGLGELSTHLGFAGGQLFAEESGTSFAAPHIAHQVAMLLVEYPDASADLIRALLGAHARIPEEGHALLADHGDRRRSYGYGAIDAYALTRSKEDATTLMATDGLENRHHHFYEIPVPEEFSSAGRRVRQITIALAHSPLVRSTRIGYRATRLSFRLVAAPDLAHVTNAFNRATRREDYERMSELGGADVGPQMREAGTLQAATWEYKQFTERSRLKRQRLFAVVTRNDHAWGEPHAAVKEQYALVACLRDRENQQARLYSELRNRLQARPRARARA